MSPGDMVQIPSTVHDWRRRVTYVYLTHEDIVLDEVGLKEHFEVPIRTIGLLLIVGPTDMYNHTWCKVMFPQGVGWVNRSWLEVLM